MSFKKNISVYILCLFLFFCTSPYEWVNAEGETVTLSVVTSSSTVNIGKTFNVTLMANPNMNVDIQGFDAGIKFDSSKLELVKDDGNPKIIRPSGVNDSYLMSANVTGDIINIFCEDPSLSAPIQVKGSTALITFSFIVKDSAAPGSSAEFSLTDGSVTTIYNQQPESAQTLLSKAASVKIGSRLDTNNYLSSLSVEGYSISPAFARDVYDYTIVVPEDVTSITVNTSREVPTSVQSISGTDSLNYGDNMVTITVTAQDTDRVRRYRITVKREFPPQESSDIESSSELSEESSNSEVSDIVTPTIEITPQPTSSEDELSSYPQKNESTNENYWKTIAIISTALFLICAGVMVWLIFDKISNRGKIIKIKRK